MRQKVKSKKTVFSKRLTKTKRSTKQTKSNGWSALESGDIVDVVAPGWATEPENLILAQEFLRSWGLVPRIPENFLQPTFLGSNTPEARFQHLEKALQSKDSKMIWCLRGGYGSLHLLPYLKKLKKPTQQKLLIGISDITSLHSFVNHKWNWSSLHAPLLDRMARGLVDDVHLQEMKEILFGRTAHIEFTTKLIPLNATAQKTGKIKSQVVGGNLTVFQSLIGTGFQVSLKNKILFLEDLGERGYRIDRALHQLQQASDLDQAKAIVFGDFLGGEEKDGQILTGEVMKIWAQKMKMPVLCGLEAGHGLIQRPVPFFTPTVLTLGSSPVLDIQTGIKK